MDKNNRHLYTNYNAWNEENTAECGYVLKKNRDFSKEKLQLDDCPKCTERARLILKEGGSIRG